MAKAKRTTRRRTTRKRRAAPRAKRVTKRSKKATPKRISRTTVKTSGATHHHAVMRMPFSSATAQPKIPDGKVSTSLSRRLQKVVQIQNAVNAETIDVVMVPSLGVCGSLYGSTNPVGTRTYECIGFSGQTVGLDGSTLPTFLSNKSDIQSWRIVSQAMKFQLNQTEEENDGWFEAVRFHLPQHYGIWAFANLNNQLNQGSMGLFPGQYFKNVVDNVSGNMVELPGYTTGLLKDLHKHEFKLNPKTQEVNFNSLKNEYGMTDASGATVGTWDPLNKECTFNDRIPESVEVFEDMIDHDYDMILLRLHCRTNNGSTSAGSKLIMNAIQNIEFCFSPESDLSAFQTRNDKHKNTDNIVSGLSNRKDASEHILPRNHKSEAVVTHKPNDIAVTKKASEEFEHWNSLGKEGHVSKEAREYWDGFLQESKMSTFLDAAYSNPNGYAIRVNPITGKKEMMIAGTRSRNDFSIRDWMQNLAEGIHHTPVLPEIVDDFTFEGAWDVIDTVGAYSEGKRDEGSMRYESIAREEGVEVVYGHSRGAAVMSGMNGPWESVGLDGASYIGHHKSYTNIVQRYGPFDRMIGAGHKGNIGVSNVAFHNVTVKKGKGVKRKSPGDLSSKRQKMSPKKKARSVDLFNLKSKKRGRAPYSKSKKKKKKRVVSDDEE